MLARLALLATCLVLSRADEGRSRSHHKYTDPFALLDRHMSLALSHDHSLLPHISAPIFWPWTELAKAAGVVLDEDSIEEPSVHSDPDEYQIKLNVRSYTPQEIKVRVKNKAVLIEGKRIIVDEETQKKFVGNHFLQRYTLPPGVDPQEVTAELKANGILVVSAPRRPPPPPPQERVVPIVYEEPPVIEDVRPTDEPKPTTPEPEKPKPNSQPNKEPEKSDATSDPNKPKESEDEPTDQKLLKEQLEVSLADATGDKDEAILTEHTPASEASAVSGKIRKKELKEDAQDARKNETKKSTELEELEYVVENNVTGD